MKQEQDSLTLGSEIDVTFCPDEGGEITTVGIVKAVRAIKEFPGFDVIEVEFTDPRDGMVHRTTVLSASQKRSGSSGLAAMAERHEARAGELRRLTEEAAL